MIQLSRLIFIKLLGFIILLVLMACETVDRTNASSEVKQINLPSYTVYKDKSYENQRTSKVIWEIIITSAPTIETINSLLNKLYGEAQLVKFKQHDSARVIDIKAYISKEHAESGMGQWIGWISKNGYENVPKITLQEGQIDSLIKGDEVKFGLDENRRKQIWFESAKADDKARIEAEKKFPEPKPNQPGYMKVMQNRVDYEDELIDKYRIDLARKYKLDSKTLKEIINEGLEENWLFPK